MNRAIIKKFESHYRIYVDGIYVGRGTSEAECIPLTDELNASDEKCDLLIGS
jgi:hypothetical protein